jgi:hypothetical protein
VAPVLAAGRLKWRCCYAPYGVEAERETLPAGIARIMLAAVRPRNFPIEAKRGAVVDARGVPAKMLREQLATQAAHDLRVPD